jgi:multiple sugar transport system permease protein
MDSKRKHNLAFILPAIIFLAFGSLFPFFYSLIRSFQQWNLNVPGDVIKFVGFRNYVQLFTNFELFGRPLIITMIFVVCSVALEFLLALLLASVLSSRDIKGKNFFRTCLIIPMATTPVIVGLMGKYLFSDFGIVNHYLLKIGIPTQPWLGSATLALAVVIIMEVWQWTPFMTLILEAGLNNIPKQAVEAASIDGAKPLQITLFIKVPMLKKLIALALMLRTMDCIRIFDMIWSFTGGGPVQATETVSISAYRVGFRYFNIGLGSAYSYLILITVILISLIFVNIITREESAW